MITRIKKRPTSACRVYLVRHGTTTINMEDCYRGRRDVPLDVQGYQDAVEAARRLADIGLTAVYTGPLRRTIAMAEIIADLARLPDLRILQGLNNVDYGAWEGMTAEEAAIYDTNAFALYLTSPRQAVCPQGERLLDAQERILAALQFIGSRHPGEAVAAVTHAVMIRLVLMELTGADGEDWRRTVNRGSVIELHIEDGTIRLAALPDQNGHRARLGARMSLSSSNGKEAG
jgi:broad specificity phosphatase PhoE